MLLPIIFFQAVFPYPVFSEAVVIAYYLIIIPLVLPRLFELSGFKVDQIPMFDFSGGMNQATIEKQKELDGRQNKSEQLPCSEVK